MAKKEEHISESDNIFTPINPILRIPDTAIDAELVVNRAMNRYEQFQSDRVDWLRRREEYYLGWDDYVSPVRESLFEGSSNFHLPLTEIQCAQMHSQLMQAVFFTDPIFTVVPQETVDVARLKKVERMMRYIVMSYSNYHEGIYNAIDDYNTDLTVDGMGFLSRSWKVDQRRFVTVEKNPAFQEARYDIERAFKEDMDESEFKEMVDFYNKEPYAEVSRIRTVFNGPIVSAIDPTSVLFKGDVVDSTNLNEHETVIRVVNFSKNDLIKFRHTGFMDEDAVDKILAYGPDTNGSSTHTSRTSQLNFFKDRTTGVRTQNPDIDGGQYEFFIVYDNVCCSNAKHGLADRLVSYVHPGTNSLARWTYLDRISFDGKIPIHMGHLYRRPRRSIGRGMVETQNSMQEISDILINQSIDAGLLANNPMFFYRKDSSFDPEEIRVEAGLGIGVEDPNQDIRFPQFKTNPNWSAGIQQTIQSMSSQLTALGPARSGIVAGAVGPMRSTSGVDRMIGLGDQLLDVVLKRALAPISQLLNGLYADCAELMPDCLKVPVLGEYGVPVMDEDGIPISDDITPEDLRMKVHFLMAANSQTTNREKQVKNAQLMLQALMQPATMKTGIVKPENIYEMYDHYMSLMGVQRRDRFISKPQGYDQMAVPYTLEVNFIMQGMMPPVTLNDPEHQEKIEKLTELLNSDQAQLEVQHGKVHANAMTLLQKTIAEHEKFLAVQNRPSQMGNPTGENVSATLGQGVRPGRNNPQLGTEEGQPQASASEGIEDGGSGEEEEI